jgi:hypothetical protein
MQVIEPRSRLEPVKSVRERIEVEMRDGAQAGDVKTLHEMPWFLQHQILMPHIRQGWFDPELFRHQMHAAFEDVVAAAESEKAMATAGPTEPPEDEPPRPGPPRPAPPTAAPPAPPEDDPEDDDQDNGEAEININAYSYVTINCPLASLTERQRDGLVALWALQCFRWYAGEQTKEQLKELERTVVVDIGSPDLLDIEEEPSYEVDEGDEDDDQGGEEELEDGPAAGTGVSDL